MGEKQVIKRLTLMIRLGPIELRILLCVAPFILAAIIVIILLFRRRK